MPNGFRVIYPRGDKTALSTAYVADYEEGDWSLASRLVFGTESEAEQYGRVLAIKHNLVFQYSDEKHRYLD